LTYVKKDKFIEVFTRKSNKETTEELKSYENIDKALQDVSEAHNWFV